MQESPELQKERALSRRIWSGCLLTFAVAAAIILVVTILPLGMFSAKSLPPGALLLLALAGLLFTIAVGIGGMVLILRITAWSAEGVRQKHQRGTEVLQRTLPGVDAGANAPALDWSAAALSKQLFRFLLFIIAISTIYLAVNAALSAFVPSVPGITAFALMFALGAIVLMLKPSLLNTKPLTAGKEQAPEQGRSLLAGILYTIVIVLPTLGIIPLFGYVPVPGLLMPLVALGLCAGVFMAANVIYAVAPVFWIQAAVRHCNYDGALRRSRLASDYSLMPGFYRNMAGVILLWAGRYDEARAMFERSIGETRREAMGAGNAALENVGCALAWQGKYDEAIPMFEGSIAISQNEVMVYSDLAEVYLRQGTSISRALELTGRAVENNQHAPWEIRLLAGYQTGQVLATRAWSLGAAGRRKEAEETLALAFSKADKSFKPVLAGIYWRAGRVMLALDEPGRAKEYFERGRQIDPRGHYGRLCTEAMVG